MHGRRKGSVRDAVTFIKGKGSEYSKVEGLVADISTLRGMNKLCDDVLARTDRIDCLINNAGGSRKGDWLAIAVDCCRGRLLR